MRQWPLATLMSGPAGHAHISQIPLVVNEDDGDAGLALLGHLDVNNEHAAEINRGAPISFCFRGPDAYASPDLYADPQLPGWLYVSVKGNGEIESILNDEDLKDLLCESTKTFGRNEQQFSLDRTDERIDQFIGGIRGFRIKITQISGIAKLAQDKGVAHAKRASEFLLGQSHDSAADLTRQLLEETISR